MSSTTLSFCEIVLLVLGLYSNTKQDIGDIVPTEAMFEHLPPGNQALLRGLISPVLIFIRDQEPQLFKRLNKALRSLCTCTNLKILPPDKEGHIVILDAERYRQKGNKIVNNTSTYEISEAVQN